MGRGKTIGKCRLCLTENVELVNSHIFPRYVWKPIFDESRKFLQLSLKTPSVKLNTNPALQSGYKEPLLCQNCDGNIIGKYDTYAKPKLDEKFMVLNTLGLNQVEGLDYHKFKLFLLSILWRCSITTNENFKAILGPHAEVLRHAILENNPLDVNQYGCLCVGIMVENKLAIELLMNADRARFGGLTTHIIIFCGFMWVFFVSKQNPTVETQQFFLQKDGKIKVINVPVEKIKFLMNSMLKLDKLGML